MREVNREASAISSLMHLLFCTFISIIEGPGPTITQTFSTVMQQSHIRTSQPFLFYCILIFILLNCQETPGWWLSSGNSRSRGIGLHVIHIVNAFMTDGDSDFDSKQLLIVTNNRNNITTASTNARRSIRSVHGGPTKA